MQTGQLLLNGGTVCYGLAQLPSAEFTLVTTVEPQLLQLGAALEDGVGRGQMRAVSGALAEDQVMA